MYDFRQSDYLNITVTNTQNGVAIKNISTDNITTSYLPEDVSFLSVITLDDYNAMTNQNHVLTYDEILMFTKGYDIPNTFNIDDTQYSVKSLDSFPIDAGYYNMTKVSEIYIVVKNHSQLEDLYNKQLDVFDTPSELQYSVYFNLDGTDD